jgi:hypothetical protein
MVQGPATAGEVVPTGEGEGLPAPVPPAIRALRARRRRRRRPGEPRTETTATVVQPSEGEAAAAAPSASAEPEQARETTPRPPRSRHRRRRRDAPADASSADRRPGGNHPVRRDDRDGSRRHGEPASRGERREGRRDSGPRDRRGRPGGRGRDAPPRTVERKLYTTDSVVDRGFEDIEEEAGTRRVNWTIVKRTTADLISRKALSAVYVLQRDGIDAEFPSLGAARSAVNKTIVHPEKLTRGKAEYAAEKK